MEMHWIKVGSGFPKDKFNFMYFIFDVELQDLLVLSFFRVPVFEERCKSSQPFDIGSFVQLSAACPQILLMCCWGLAACFPHGLLGISCLVIWFGEFGVILPLWCFLLMLFFTFTGCTFFVIWILWCQCRWCCWTIGCVAATDLATTPLILLLLEHLLFWLLQLLVTVPSLGVSPHRSALH